MPSVFRVFLLPALLGLVLVPISTPPFGAPTFAASSERRGLDNLYATYWRDWLALEARSDESLRDSWDRDVTSLLKRIQSVLRKFNPARLPEQDRISYDLLRYGFEQERRQVHFSRGK